MPSPPNLPCASDCFGAEGGDGGINSFAMAASETHLGGTNHSDIGREGGIEGIRDDLDVRFSQNVWA